MNSVHGLPARVLRVGLQVVRDGWLIVGIAAVLFVTAEFAYRLQASARSAVRNYGREQVVDPSTHPYAGRSWWPRWLEERNGVASMYDPYRARRLRPHVAAGLNTDSSGYRMTIQHTAPTNRGGEVWMFGGSTMWGWTARDSFTIPTLTAKHLSARGVHDVRVLNLAQSAYALTQEAITLLLELRDGKCPVAAVFLDGNNDVAVAFQTGRAGGTLNEAELARRFDEPRGFWADLIRIANHSELAGRVRQSVLGPPPPAVVAPASDAICGVIARQYWQLATLIDAWGRRFHFPVFFVWQPLEATSAKRLTAWERGIEAYPGYRETQVRCATLTDSVVAGKLDGESASLSRLFDSDTATVVIDDDGHVTEAADDRIAARIADLLTSVLAPGAGQLRERHSR